MKQEREMASLLVGSQWMWLDVGDKRLRLGGVELIDALSLLISNTRDGGSTAQFQRTLSFPSL